MWVYLENWIVQAGELPELEPGARLRVGLRAQCSDVRYPATAPDGVTAPAGADAAGHAFGYAITGIAGAGRRVESYFHAPGMEPAPHPVGTEFPITVNEHVFLAMAPVGAVPVREGDRVSVVCTFSVIPEYEFEELGVPDVRADWLVGGLKIEKRRTIHDPVSGVGYDGEVLERNDIECMRRWDDDPDPETIAVSYLVDLGP